MIKGGKQVKVIDKIALALIVIGAINWGLIGIFNFNLVGAIFGDNWESILVFYIIGDIVIAADGKN